MKEGALLFGEEKSLVAVITEPSGALGRERPAVIFLNAGVLHRVGPNRIHVRLARELARHGFVSMRFDFSGLGDSRSRRDPTPFVESAVAETRQGMDLLASSRGAQSFLLIGICSGADNALRAAGLDERVVGTALIEPYGIPAPGFLLYSYRRKILNPLAWWRLLRGRSELWEMLRERTRASGEADPVPGAQSVITEAVVPSREEVLAQLRRLTERGVDLCLVYSAESPAYHNYRTLLRREVRKAMARGRAQLEVITRTDHVFTPAAAQQRLVALLADWACHVAAREAL
ncbi:MAG TPA: alpha/beta fold hydrolase [Vicinamibacteria bacterium]|nr:alpha/beta fold hydrolase [Vicinamibacteria bacterium]